MIEAIRSGEIDALVVKIEDGHHLYTLKNTDQTYRIFIEQMTSGAVTINSAGQILYCNSKFADLLGQPLEKVIGQVFRNFLADSCREEFDLIYDASWQQGKKIETLLYTSPQRETPVLISLKTLDLDEGLSMSVIVTDLSEQKLTQKLLQDKNDALEIAQQETHRLNTNLENTVRERTKELYSNQQYLTQILETMAEGVGIIDVNGNMNYANPMAQRILGLKKSEVEGLTFDDPKWQNIRIDGSVLPEQEHPINVMMRTGKPLYDNEIGIKPPDKDIFYISINAAPIYDEQKKLSGGIVTFMDVTNRRKSIQQKDEFISVASHELRTPITSLKASLQLLSRLKDNLSSEMLPKLIDQSNKSMNKVSTLINDLLNATKLTEGQLSLNRSVFTAKKLIEESGIKTLLTSNLNVVIEGDVEMEINADIDKIDQVMINFITNAIKYAPESKTIKICIEQSSNHVKIAVKDYGKGIPAEMLPHLFERFYRVDSGGHQYSGLGLGLYISSEIIKRHNGEIGAESEEGIGSTFWFKLPRIIN